MKQEYLGHVWDTAVKSILAAHYAVQREVIRDQAGKMGWSHTVAIVSTIQRVVLKSAGSTHPLKEGRV